jgi:hypothetical protein
MICSNVSGWKQPGAVIDMGGLTSDAAGAKSNTHLIESGHSPALAHHVQLSGQHQGQRSADFRLSKDLESRSKDLMTVANIVNSSLPTKSEGYSS